MFKHILLATDGSKASAHAAAIAVDLALSQGAALTAIYVIDPYPFMLVGEANPYGFQAYMAAAQAEAAKAHADVEAMCRAGGPPVTLQVRLVEDVTTASGIVQTAKAEGADLIVLGSHGRSGIARLMLGSVATKVAAESPVPVLIAR